MREAVFARVLTKAPVMQEEIQSKEEAISKEEVKVSHPKYGIGTIVSEDDMMITAKFQGYGQKQFMKSFSELNYL